MTTTLTQRAILTALAAASFGAILAGCNSGPQPKPISQLTPQENRGRYIFARRCAECHSDRNDVPQQGPALVHVFKQQYLPSGLPANDERVTAIIQRGRGMMPRQPDIVGQNLEDLLVYMHSL